MLEFIEYMNLPTRVGVALVGVILFVNAVGEFLSLKGKVVPEFIQMRKFFKRKREERETLKKIPETLTNVQVLLDNVNQHYSTDNIMMRDKWIENVNNKLEANDQLIKELVVKLDKNNADTLALRIDSKRNFIIDFAAMVADGKKPVTREQFNRFFKEYYEYEEIIRENGMTNGEVDIAFRIGTEAYEDHMRNHTFLEDVRGYDIKI